MEIGVELYLRDRVVCGLLSTYEGRTLDLFNDPRVDCINVYESQTESLHLSAEPRESGTLSIQKKKILLIVPYDVPPTLQAKLRGWWVPKRPVRVEVGIGPFSLEGLLHYWQNDAISLHEIACGPSSRSYIPITEVMLESVYRQEWTAQRETVFALRSAIDTIGTVEVFSEEDSLEPQPVGAIR
jgi:hypothetical protein